MISHGQYLAGSQRWGTGALLSVAMHLGIAFVVLWQTSNLTPLLMPPAAVSVQLAPQFEVTMLQPQLPVGIQQQRQQDSSRQQTERSHQRPELAEAKNGELQKQNETLPATNVTPEPPTRPKKRASTQLKAQAGNAQRNSQAAPPQQTLAKQTAAPVNSDSAVTERHRLNWQALVKGKIISNKDFPADARQRNRTGVALVRFIVDAAGNLVNSQLVKTSGTLSLDREALAVLSRSSPFPPPPAGILLQGRYQVTMPISFDLTTR